jgi:hypothetical protein
VKITNNVEYSLFGERREISIILSNMYATFYIGTEIYNNALVGILLFLDLT